MKNTAKVVGIGGGALAIAGIIGGIVSAPYTMGASLGATAAGVAGLTGAAGATAALTIGTITLSTAEVAIIATALVSALGVSLVVAKDFLKHYDLKVGNGVVELIRKN